MDVPRQLAGCAWRLLVAVGAVAAVGACQPQRFYLAATSEGETTVLTAEAPARMLTVRACTDDLDSSSVELKFSGEATGAEAPNPKVQVSFMHDEGLGGLHSVKMPDGGAVLVEVEGGFGSDPCGAGTTLAIERLDPELKGEVRIEWSLEAKAMSFHREFERDTLTLFVDE